MAIRRRAAAQDKLKTSGEAVLLRVDPEAAESAVRDAFAGLGELVAGTLESARDAIEARACAAAAVGRHEEAAALRGMPTVAYMVGGCAVVPALKEVVREALPAGAQVIVSASADTAVADGCAIQAAARAGLLAVTLQQCTTRGLSARMRSSDGDDMLVHLIQPGTPSDQAHGMYTCAETGALDALTGSFSLEVYQSLSQDPLHWTLAARDRDMSFEHPAERGRRVDPNNVLLSAAREHFVKLGEWRIPRVGRLPSPAEYSDPPHRPVVLLHFEIDDAGTVKMWGQVQRTEKFRGRLEFQGRVESAHMLGLLAESTVAQLAGEPVEPYARIAALAAAKEAAADESSGGGGDADTESDDDASDGGGREAKRARV